MLGQPWSRKTIAAAQEALAEEFQPLSDHRGSAKYRMLSAQNLPMKYFLERTEPGTATRISELA